jgi:aminopeptidase
MTAYRKLKRFTRNILFDEKIGGTIHTAIGNSFAEAGGDNRSGIHLDMVCDMKNQGEIYADDKLIYRNGKFL